MTAPKEPTNDNASTSIDDSDPEHILLRFASNFQITSAESIFTTADEFETRVRADLDVALAAINRIRQADRTETEKAYGGCRNCYGKGYATKQDFITGGGKKWKASAIKYCYCPRGKQLEAVMLADRQELIARVDTEARLDELESMYQSSTVAVSPLYDPLSGVGRIEVFERITELTQLKGEKQS